MHQRSDAYESEAGEAAAILATGYVIAPCQRATGQPQLYAEWQAILRGKGYGMPFPRWLLGIAHFHHVPYGLPTQDFLEDVVQYVKFDCEALARAEARERRARFQFTQEMDRRHKSSAALFSSVRGPPNPPFAHTPHTATARVLPVDRPVWTPGQLPSPKFRMILSTLKVRKQALVKFSRNNM